MRAYAKPRRSVPDSIALPDLIPVTLPRCVTAQKFRAAFIRKLSFDDGPIHRKSFSKISVRLENTCPIISGMADINGIVQALKAERDRISSAISALEGVPTRRAGREFGNARRKRKVRKLLAAARKG